MDEQECQQDVLKRTQKWLNALEERIVLLMNANSITKMKPGECEQAGQPPPSRASATTSTATSATRTSGSLFW